MSDFRYALRALRRAPGFAVVAILTLALGIGANTAMFSLINAVLLRPMPVDDAGALVSIFTTDKRNPGNLPMSHLNFQDVRDENPAFSGVAAFTFGQVNFQAGAAEPEPIPVQLVSGNYFSVLGVRPVAGRTFLPEEDRTPRSHPVAILSYGFWQRQFGGSQAIVGRTITLNRTTFTVVGVAPRDFNGVFVFGNPALWAPLMMHDVLQPGFDFYDTRRGLFLFPFGRLKPGVSQPQADAALKTIASRLEAAYPNDNRGRSTATVPLLEARIDPNGEGQLIRLSSLLMAVVGVVLLIACANLANLLLARASGRSREMAVRVAIGASRMRIVRQLVVESLTLSIAGGVAGVLLAVWVLQAIVRADIQLPLPAIEHTRIDLPVLAFAALVSVATGLLFGLAPALRTSRPDLVAALKDVTTAIGHRRRLFTMRTLLVVSEVALSLAALVAAALFARGLQRTQAIDPGFETDSVLVGGVNPGREGYSEARGLLFYEQLTERLSTLPGVRAATMAQNAPFDGGFSRSILLEGQEAERGDRILIQVNRVGLRYFETLGIPLVDGRDFTSGDRADSPRVVVINQTMAEKLWPGTSAIGKRFRFFGDDTFTEVAGVVKDSKYNGLAEEPIPFIYEALAQQYVPAAALHVRTAGDAGALTNPVRRLVAELDPHLTVLELEPLSVRVSRSLDGPRSNVTLLSVFGGLALLLAAIGIYGVTSYTVSQQTREIGIRMALGASRAGVLALVLRQAMTIIAAGLAVGLVGAALAARAVQSLLGDMPWRDPIAFAGTVLLLALVSVVAILVPAARATRVDPLIALRQS
jgi:macrolide transport system ATP-binding/permease protein